MGEWMEATIFGLPIILCKSLISITKYRFDIIISNVPKRKSRLSSDFPKAIETEFKYKTTSFFNLTQGRRVQ